MCSYVPRGPSCPVVPLRYPYGPSGPPNGLRHPGASHHRSVLLSRIARRKKVQADEPPSWRTRSFPSVKCPRWTESASLGVSSKAGGTMSPTTQGQAAVPQVSPTHDCSCGARACDAQALQAEVVRSRAQTLRAEVARSRAQSLQAEVARSRAQTRQPKRPTSNRVV